MRCYFRTRHLRVNDIFFCSVHPKLIICSHIIGLIELTNMTKGRFSVDIIGFSKMNKNDEQNHRIS